MNWNKCIAVILNGLVIALWVATARADTTVTCDPLGSADSISIASDAAQSSQCDSYLNEAGQDAKACQWRFEYRSGAATEAFAASEAALDGCFNKTIPVGTEVNHPDSFNQIFYTTETQLISLSLKDKAQHQATYLFLRIETAP